MPESEPKLTVLPPELVRVQAITLSRCTGVFKKLAPLKPAPLGLMRKLLFVGEPVANPVTFTLAGAPFTIQLSEAVSVELAGT